jgi:hypothetical protein
MQHSNAMNDGIQALAQLGISYPSYDQNRVWHSIRARLVEAFASLRDFIRTSLAT